ncbi:hypothetical protein [Desulfosarcina ovata]|nr:hypothetical protein [Desulfosarcina ovata]
MGKNIDPIEKTIEAVLSPGNFISYNTAWSFVHNVQDVANGIGEIIQNEPKRAARLYELFIAACHEKADEIDDSSGNFGMMVGDLFCSWIKAMKASDKGDLASQIELWLEKKEIDRLVSRLRRATDKELEDLSHYCTEPLVQKLERSHPYISARVYRALCMRIVIAGKSKYYDAALDHVERAKKCYVKAGRDADWLVVVADVRNRHFRKKAFMSGFEDIVAGTSRYVEPPFMERAKTRWPKRLKDR